MRINIYKSFLFIITLITLLLGNIITLNMFNLYEYFDYRWLVVLIYTLILLFFTLELKKVTTKSKLYFSVIWIFFIFSIFFSKYTDDNFLIFEFLLFIIIPIVFFSQGILKYKNIILFSSIISFIPFLYFLQQWNSLGMLLCMMGIILLNILHGKNVKDKYVYFLISVLGILIFITESRTSLIVFSFVAFIHIFIRNFRITNSYISFIKKMVTLVTIVLLIYLSYDVINDLIFNKRSGTGDDLTSGRSDMWIGTIEYGLSMFGNGANYYMYIYNIGDAHNTFIQVLGEYGLISFIIFILIFFYIIYKSLRLENIEYLCFFGGYFGLGLAETLLFVNIKFISIDIIFFLYLGALINEKPNRFLAFLK